MIPQEIFCKTALNKTGIPGYTYGMNPYVGCTHGCLYCYASFMCRFSGHREKWGEFLDAKTNFPAVLAKQLSNRRTPPTGKVLLGTVTDAYQPAEAHYLITRDSLQILADYQKLDVHILTKSALVQRDLPILRQMRSCEVGFTITTLDSRIARVFEPQASPPESRLEAARQLIQAGIPVWVFIAPLLPGLADTDEALHNLLLTVHQAGIREILIDYLNPYPVAVYNLKNAYQQFFPRALPALEAYLRQPGPYQEEMAQRVHQVSGAIGCRPYFV